jgi:hypothetical protein
MRKFNRQMIKSAVLVLRRSFLTLTCLATAGMLFTAAPVLAQNPHFTSGPTSTTTDGTLQVCSTISGLGSTTTDITLSCPNVTFQCVNKAGSTNNAHQTLTATQEFTPHNGTIKNACVSVTATCPPGQAGPTNVDFGTCTYDVSQGGTIVLSSSITP